MTEKFMTTDKLRIAYEVSGPTTGEPVILLHGWPDDARTWDGVLPGLHAAGYRAYVPSLRGFGQTTFLSQQTRRTGGALAFADDLRQFIQALDLAPARLIGQDWGAFTALTLSAVMPTMVKSQVILAEGWQLFSDLNLQQIQNFWYQWYFTTEQGATYLRQRRDEFTQYLWQLWSPQHQLTEAETTDLAAAFQNPDWAEITLNTYRERWGYAPFDGAYADWAERLRQSAQINASTLNIIGKSDTCTDYRLAPQMAPYFEGAFKQEFWDATGHFIQREAPTRLSRAAVSWFRGH